MDICLRTSPTCALLLTLRAQKKAQKEKAKQNRVHLGTFFCFAPPSSANQFAVWSSKQIKAIYSDYFSITNISPINIAHPCLKISKIVVRYDKLYQLIAGNERQNHPHYWHDHTI